MRPHREPQESPVRSEAVDAGAFGFSTTILNQHHGHHRPPLACRNASRDELKSYCNALKERNKGAIEIALTQKISVLTDDDEELLASLLEESGRPVSLLALFQRE